MKIVFVCVNILSSFALTRRLFSVFSKLLCIGLVFLSPWYGLVNVFARYQVLKHPCSVLSPLSSTTQSSSFSLTDSLDKTSSCERKKQAFLLCDQLFWSFLRVIVSYWFVSILLLRE